MKILKAYFDKETASFAKDLTAAKALLNPALTGLNLDPAVAAATVCVARAIFNTDNFITRE